MPAAAQLALNEDRHCPAEILAGCSGAELLALAAETSPVYDGLVLGKALEIAQRRIGLNTLQIGKRLGVGKSTIYRALLGKPIRNHGRFERGMRELALLLLEEGQ